MNRQPDELLDEQKAVPLKLDDPVVDADDPWSDDLLARKEIAGRLTNFVADQKPPLSISLHGQWGTGKTFLLRRWQRDLEIQRFKAIYFNAWEDDFCDDPLLAILGQMPETFKRGNLKTLTRQIVSTGATLLKNNAVSVLSKHTGVSLDTASSERDLLQEYLHMRATKDELKKRLRRLSEAVFKQTSHPLVFIIDELDRCRPTFAIELLERVKHIFDVPYLVFIFGINRDELCKSLSSIYGEIDTDVYLRRFFDFEFQLQELDSRTFAEHLIQKFQLDEAFLRLDGARGGTIEIWGNSATRHIYNYSTYRTIVPSLWSALRLSLRDIEYGIRLMAFLVRSVRPRVFSHPYLLSVMLALKFRNPEYYRQLISGHFRASEIMDYLANAVRQTQFDRILPYTLDLIEGFLYCADETNIGRMQPGERALVELSQLSSAPPGTQFLVISQRAQMADQNRLGQIQRAISDGRQLGVDGRVLGELAALIDTYQAEVRP